MFVCVNKENSILGCVAMSKNSPDDTSIELRRMRVARRARGSGIAQLLLDKAEEFAWSRGENRIELTTSLAQFAAIKFYKRNGYIQAKYAREHDITFGFLPGIRRRLVIMHKECPAHLE
ncbi:putative N-acetyltransferase 14 [Convolutriloba macropyga]|uniref:putative N-acetyltransferase 14 n=1 Tax=Convolutriloba macropyga TaxID=536237 RepID=UPI003F521F63